MLSRCTSLARRSTRAPLVTEPWGLAVRPPRCCPACPASLAKLTRLPPVNSLNREVYQRDKQIRGLQQKISGLEKEARQRDAKIRDLEAQLEAKLHPRKADDRDVEIRNLKVQRDVRDIVISGWGGMVALAVCGYAPGTRGYVLTAVFVWMLIIGSTIKAFTNLR